ncbi:RNA polymerase sigma-70 factor, ECF subfamily [Bradyrhizobium sp. Gha]|nr:RNA polymerase sigma-70 factor, ECF subfamily [Bradyrhizobium sp. Gha]
MKGKKKSGTFVAILHPMSGTKLNEQVTAMQRTVAGQTAAIRTSEAELIDRARGRDEAALRQIMQANNRRLYRLARGILRSDSEAEDVVQETYVRAFTHLDGFKGESALSTWLSRIAINEALGRVRSAKPDVELGAVGEEALEAQIIKFPVSPPGDPERTMAQREIQRVVERAIDELPDVFRMVFVARVMEGMTIEETADLLAVKPETVKTRLHRARTMLREIVEKEIGPVMMDAFPFAGWRCERLTLAVLKRLGIGG